jgi:hypothetical protein
MVESRWMLKVDDIEEHLYCLADELVSALLAGWYTLQRPSHQLLLLLHEQPA